MQKSKMPRTLSGRAVLAFFMAVILGLGMLNSHYVWEIMARLVRQVGTGSFQYILPTVFGLTDSLTDGFYEKDAFINADGWIHKLLGQPEMNEIYKMKNGHLTDVFPRADTSANAAKMVALDEALRERGIGLLYVEAPSKIAPGNADLPDGVEDYTNENAAEFLRAVQAAGIDTLQLSAFIAQEQLDYGDMFLKTDHHWTSEVGFWAFQKLAQKLQDDYGALVPPEVVDLSEYRIETFEKILLGSHGKRTGIYYAGVDDLSIVIPQFDTHISIDSPHYAISGEGRYEDVIYRREFLSGGHFDQNQYLVHIGWDYPVTMIRNQQAPDARKILVLKDSFGLSSIPYLSLCFAGVDMVDLRYYEDMSLIDYIDKHQPDLVILQYSTRHAGADDRFFRFFSI